MTNNQNNSFSCRGNGPVRPSFGEVLENVKQKVDLGYIDCRDSALALELCKIIAEAMLLYPEREMQIGRDMIPVAVVQEIFGMLTADHLELVISNFKEQRDRIRNKKAYLRAALYNSAFEIEAHYTNIVKHDIG